MDKDVQGKINKLCAKYNDAAGAVNLLRPAKPVALKVQRRVEGRLSGLLGDLQDARKPLGAALVRLAYVRGLRASQPGARLGPDNEREVAFLEKELDTALGRVEAAALWEFRHHLHRLNLTQAMKSIHVSGELVDAIQPSGNCYALEQHARASALSVVEMAETAGALAGAAPGGYDGIGNAA